MKYQTNVTPSQDTGWGLIFRVNDILKEIETLAINGNYKDWNFKLDRIWANLCYREKCVVEYNKDGTIKEIKLAEGDFKEKEFLDNKINEAKRKMNQAKRKHGEKFDNSKLFIEGKNELYQRLLIKDIWIRKKMYEQKLYIKEMKSNPAGAMWGRE